MTNERLRRRAAARSGRAAPAAALLGVLACLSAGPAAAGDLPRLSLTPFGGYAFGGRFSDTAGAGSVEVDDAPVAGLIVNLRDSPGTQWEIYYARLASDADTADVAATAARVDLDIEYLHLGGTYVFDGRRARPFVAAGIGGTRFDPEPLTFGSETFFSFALGAGWYLRAAERLDLRVEGRVTGTVLGADTDLFCASSGVENTCAIAADGDVYWQFQAALGIVFRF